MKNSATATWNGNLKSGNGAFILAQGLKGEYSFHSRFEDGQGTNPEELIAGAHAACFSMAFSNELDKAGFTPNRVETTAQVTLSMTDNGPAIMQITLTCNGDVPNISEAQFHEIAEAAKTGCPISKALASVETITLNATLKRAAA